MRSIAIVSEPTMPHIGVGFAVMLLLAFFATACETTTHGQQGEVLGGVIGGVIGAQVGDGRLA